MTIGRLAALGCGVAALAVSAAYAADPIEIEVKGKASLVTGVSDGDAESDFDAEITFTGSSVLDNGIEIGSVIQGRIDGDQPRQNFAGGRYSSLLIGGPRGVGPLTSDAYIQGAYGFARGPFGKIVAGRDQGVGRTLAVTSPTIFQSFNVNDWRSDLSGINDIHTVNDFSGYSTKITYLPPANFLGGVFGGLQLGVSYSPTLRNCGERLCAPEEGFLLAPDGTLLIESSEWDDVIEAALYYQKEIKLGENGVFFGLGASFVTADENTRAASPIFDDYEAYSVGINLAYRGITLGGSVKTTNAGIDTPNVDDGYLAFDAGVTYETGPWGFMVGYGQSEANVIGPNLLDPTLFRDTQTAQAGVTYFIGRGISIGAAAQYVETTKPAAAGGLGEATTVVIESSIKF